MAMAQTFAHYAAPTHARPAAALAVIALTAVNCAGIGKTARVTRWIVACVLATLAVIVFAVLHGGDVDTARWVPTEIDAHAVLQSAGLWFFAFAGFARLATLGEEVVDPVRTLPRAIPLALGLTLLVYAAVALAVLAVVDAGTLAMTSAPLVATIDAAGWPNVAPAVRTGAAVASLGVLLSLLAGISRTMFAMAANDDLPRPLAAVHPRRHVPQRAELLAGGAVALAVLVVDVRDAIGFSAFTVLVYYAIANAAALTLAPGQRHWPRTIATGGLAGCVALALALPARSVVCGIAVLAAGWVVWRLVAARR